MQTKQPQEAAAKPHRYSVRAMPAPGHTHRRRIGRAWGKDPTAVTVVDKPTPPRTEIDRDKRKVVIYSDEISPTELATLQSDPHLAVIPMGDGAGDANELNRLKAQMAKMGEELTKARTDQQEAVELLQVQGDAARKNAEENGRKIASLEADLAQARAALTKKTAAAEKSEKASAKGE